MPTEDLASSASRATIYLERLRNGQVDETYKVGFDEVINWLKAVAEDDIGALDLLYSTICLTKGLMDVSRAITDRREVVNMRELLVNMLSSFGEKQQLGAEYHSKFGTCHSFCLELSRTSAARDYFPRSR